MYCLVPDLLRTNAEATQQGVRPHTERPPPRVCTILNITGKAAQSTKKAANCGKFVVVLPGFAPFAAVSGYITWFGAVGGSSCIVLRAASAPGWTRSMCQPNKRTADAHRLDESGTHAAPPAAEATTFHVGGGHPPDGSMRSGVPQAACRDVETTVPGAVARGMKIDAVRAGRRTGAGPRSQR
jgi:hypothetical protein